jgi:hypothetical protein
VSSYATSSHRLPISTPITLLPFIPTSVILVGSGPSTGLYTGESPIYRSCSGPQRSRRASRSARSSRPSGTSGSRRHGLLC